MTAGGNGRFRTGLAHAAFALGVSLLLLSPMILTGRSFGADWVNHLWVLYAQGDAISNGGPSLFLHADRLGVFDPHFAFYGGTLYTLGGSLSLVLGGQPVVAYLIIWLAGFLMAYGGMLWLGFQAGLSGWRVHVAPLVVVTGAYYITNAYARGAWPELVATSAIPLLLASALSLFRAPTVRLGPAGAFFAAVVIFTGSHNLTLAWGSLVIGALALVAIIAVPALRRVEARRVLIIGGLAALAVGVNAWFLLPDVVYGNRTLAAAGHAPGLVFPDATTLYGGLTNLFDPVRVTPREGKVGGLDTQVPVLIIAWLLVAGVLSARRRADTRLLRAAAGIAVLLAILFGLVMSNWPWEHLPSLLTAVQFSFRLESYILIVLGILAVLLLRSMDSWDDRSAGLKGGLTVVLVAGLALGAGQAVWQAWSTPSLKSKNSSGALSAVTRSEGHRDPHTVPSSWYAFADYRDRSHPVKAAPVSVPLDPAAVKDDVLQATIPASAKAAPVAVNVSGGPYLVEVRGARYVGRSAESTQVLVASAPRSAQSAKIRVGLAQTLPVRAGRWISFVALAAVFALLFFYSITSLAQRRQHK